jgi:hypothetical protein
MEALKEAAFLNGCYVIKTDLPREAADTQIITTGIKTSPWLSRRSARARPTFSK